jgi:hypothetical protein
MNKPEKICKKCGHTCHCKGDECPQTALMTCVKLVIAEQLSLN